MEVRGTLSEQDLKSAAWLHLKPRPFFAVLGLIVLALLLWALWFSFFSSKPVPAWAKWGLVAGLIYLLSYYFIYVPLYLKRRYRQYKALHKEQVLSPTESGLTIATDNTNGTVPWTDFIGWKESSSLFMLYVADGMYNVVPKYWLWCFVYSPTKISM